MLNSVLLSIIEIASFILTYFNQNGLSEFMHFAMLDANQMDSWMTFTFKGQMIYTWF